MRYISRVYIVVEAEDENEAADAMSACLSENLKYDGHIVDWSYSATEGVYDHPVLLVPASEDLEDEDLQALYADSRAAIATATES